VIVLGIDPGTAALGYGIVDRNGHLREVDHGCLVTTARQGLPERLQAIHAHVAELIELHRPDVMAVERVFFSRNVQTALAVGQARGVILLAAAQAGIPVREATPSEVKSAVAGDGRASKDQIGRMVAIILGLDSPPVPDDAADALAIAIWAAHRDRQVDRTSAPVLDRAAIAPLEPGATPYDRAVREALRREAANDATAGAPGAAGRPRTARPAAPR
jgi:crossover junction endodeoxyribonuclease RuvC